MDIDFVGDPNFNIIFCPLKLQNHSDYETVDSLFLLATAEMGQVQHSTSKYKYKYRYHYNPVQVQVRKLEFKKMHSETIILKNY